MKVRIHIKVFGTVQGVFFRAGTQNEAKRLNITGWIKNCNDGSVEVIAEGQSEKLEELLEWCMHGPSNAEVSHCEYEWLNNEDKFTSFEIRY